MTTAFHDPLQSIVDQLAADLQRSVIIEDSSLRPLAFSAQLGRVDPSRIDYLMQRRADTWISDVLATHRIHHAAGPVRIPADPERSTLARVVIPVVAVGQRIGLLWLIDDPELTEAQVALASSAAVEAGVVLGERATQEADAVDAGRRLLDNLVAPDAASRGAAAEALRALGVPNDAAPYLVGVVVASTAPELDRAAVLNRTATAVIRRFGSRTLVCSAFRGVELLVLTSQGRGDTVLAALQRSDPAVAVGVRRHVLALEDVYAAREDARFAAEVAGAVAEFGGAADWADLGVYASLQHVERSPESLERLCPGVAPLRAAGNSMYEHTVRAYLRRGGNAQRTAADLHVHRTTLYWRLENVERMVGLDLADGEHRLRLHMALKLMDLMQQPTAPVDRSPSSARRYFQDRARQRPDSQRQTSQRDRRPDP